MPNIQLIIEYDGTRYHGWQRQSNVPTIQGEIEKAIATIAREPLAVIGAGRTDAGVHAEGQAANFKTKSRLHPDDWQRALNSLLPEDIVIRSASKVPNRFHARFSAVGKVYRFRILNRRYAPAIGRQYLWTVFIPLNLGRMKSAAKALLGRHDFSSFMSGGPCGEEGTGSSDTPRAPALARAKPDARFRSPICTIRRLELVKNHDDLVITIEADRFLQHMVRTIVGTLVEIGRGRWTQGEMEVVLQRKARRFAGPTAPPQGLCLVKVLYK